MYVFFSTAKVPYAENGIVRKNPKASDKNPKRSDKNPKRSDKNPQASDCFGQLNTPTEKVVSDLNENGNILFLA